MRACTIIQITPGDEKVKKREAISTNIDMSIDTLPSNLRAHLSCQLNANGSLDCSKQYYNYIEMTLNFRTLEYTNK